jgi:recombination protein RecT
MNSDADKSLVERKETGVSNSIKSILDNPIIKKRFEEVLNKRAPQYMSSIINLVNGDTNLKKCDCMSIIASAMVAATLDLPIDKNLGFAWIIPYNDKAQFQMGYKGYIQLAMRTGQYKTINAIEVYEGDIKRVNRLTGEVEFDETNTKQEKIIGYIAYFRLINGFEKTFYMPVEKMEKHAKRYSQTYKSNKDYIVKNSKWSTDFDAMALKTVLKLLLSKYGILSVEMQTAIAADQGTIRNGVIDSGTVQGNVDYVDYNIEDEIVNNEVADKLEQEFKNSKKSQEQEGQITLNDEDMPDCLKEGK